jgi:hypothetical protein
MLLEGELVQHLGAQTLELVIVRSESECAIERGGEDRLVSLLLRQIGEHPRVRRIVIAIASTQHTFDQLFAIAHDQPSTGRVKPGRTV